MPTRSARVADAVSRRPMNDRVMILFMTDSFRVDSVPSESVYLTSLIRSDARGARGHADPSRSSRMAITARRGAHMQQRASLPVALGAAPQEDAAREDVTR